MYLTKEGTYVTQDGFNFYRGELQDYVLKVNVTDNSRLLTEYEVPYIGLYWGKKKELEVKIDMAIFYYTQLISTLEQFDFTPSKSEGIRKYTNVLNALKVAKYENLLKEKKC